MTKRKHRWTIIWISTLNVLVMLFIAYYWLSLPRTFGDEAFLIKWSSLVKKSLFGIDHKPHPEDVLFIDVAGSKTTINDLDALSFMPEAGYHRKVITDRSDLADLFQLMAPYRNAIDLVVCDVLFADSTTQDVALQAAINTLGDKILAVSHLQAKDELIQPVIDMPYALATYQSTQGLFLKFPLLLQDSLKTVPLYMYERTHGTKLVHSGPFYYLNHRLSLPTPIVDYKVRPSDFVASGSMAESNYAIYPLGTILESATFMDEEQMGGYFKDKIILIGDFQNDLHNTPFGQTPGLLLLYNAYLSLVERQNEIRWQWIVFLVISFFILSYRIFAEIQVRKPAWLLRAFQTKAGTYLVNALDEMGILILITLLSYFLFNIHINILIFFVYLKVVEWIWKRLKRKAPSSHKKQPS